MEKLRLQTFKEYKNAVDSAGKLLSNFVNNNPYIQIVAINTNYDKDCLKIIDLYYKIDDEVDYED